MNARLRLLALWLIVGLPLLWGITRTLENALQLLR
jgi:hypothetical protein